MFVFYWYRPTLSQMHLSRETKILILLASFFLFCLGLFHLAPDVRARKSNSFIDTNSTATPSPRPSPSPSSTPAATIDLTPDPSDSKVDIIPRELTFEDWVNASLGTKDVDCDGVENVRDNCPLAFNPKQQDRNKDGVGDVCDVKTGGNPDVQDIRCDHDGDGILDRDDNCILVCNPKQEDRNKDGVGDACDEQLNPNFVRIVPCVNKSKTLNCKSVNSRKSRKKQAEKP